MTDYTPSEKFAAQASPQLEAKQAVLTARIADIRKSVEELQNELMQHITDSDAIREILDQRLLEQESAKSTEPNWPLLLTENGSRVRNTALDTALTNLTAFRAHYQGITASGYRPETGQKALQVALYKGAPEHTARVVAALEMLLPMLKPLAAEKYLLDELEEGDQYHHISVLESTLSLHGIFWLAIRPEHQFYALCKTTYGSGRVVKRANTLRELLEFVEQQHSYKRVSDF